ncbi:hypothetical protein JQ572_32030 [Bradyrhizobium japonicum]|nr:hypothetical protein [Bradyrhizobium japonicum]
MESTEADSAPGNGVGKGAENHAAASDTASVSAAVQTTEPAVVEHGNSGHDLSSTSANAADQELVFRFDSEVTPSTPVAVAEPEELNHPHVPPGQENLEVIVNILPNALDGHAADHGNSGLHHVVIATPHDLLI